MEDLDVINTIDVNEGTFNPYTYVSALEKQYNVKSTDVQAMITKKPVVNLSPDDVIFYLPETYFPKNEYGEKIPRTKSISAYVDTNFYRCLRRLHKGHSMGKPEIRYLMFEVGALQVCEVYADTISKICDLVDQIDVDPRTEGGMDALPRLSVTQTGGHMREARSDFTNADHNWITDMTENIGVTDSSFMVVSFWTIATKCNRLQPDLVEYGDKIIKNFKDNLDLRISMLKGIL
jgi:hypothetical protein